MAGKLGCDFFRNTLAINRGSLFGCCLIVKNNFFTLSNTKMIFRSIFIPIILLSNIAFAQNTANCIGHFGLVYPISTNGSAAPQTSNDYSFHLLGGISKNENSICLSGISNVIIQNAKGLQLAGVSNIVMGKAKGLQLAGVSNIAASTYGAQISGLGNINKDSVEGVQIAGFHNMARTADVQIAGFTNIAKHTKGLQIAGFINVAQNVKGGQFAGFINIAKKVKGPQIAGFINIADSSEYPVGIINIIRNGDKSMGVSIDETGTGMLTFRSGSKKMYGILGVGYNFAEPKMQYGMEAGIGARFPFSLLFKFNAEATVLTLSNFRNGAFMKSSFRFFPSMRIARSFEVFGGPTFSFTNTPAHLAEKFDIPYVWSRYSNGTFYGMNIGAIAGLQVHF